MIVAVVTTAVLGSAVRFVFGGWRRPVPVGFTYHRESGMRMLLPILPLLAIGDVLLLDLLILPDAAWWLRLVVHGVAIYGLIWLVGLYASVRARPHTIANGRLTLHRGMLRHVEVPLADVAAVERLPSFGDDWKKRAYCKGAIRVDVAGGAVVELRLRTPARAIGVLGEGPASTRVLLAVDDPAPFIAAIRA